MAVQVSALDAGLTTGVPWRKVGAGAGAVFLVSTLAGWLLAPAAPSPFAGRLRVHEYFVDHHDAAMNQSLLIHGVAGVALIVLAVALWHVLAVSRQRAALVAAGVGAGLASLVQLLFVFRIEHHIEHGIGVRQTDLLFDNLNHVLAAKLVLLALAVGAASLLTTRRTKLLAYAVVAVLAVAAIATLTRVPNAQAILSLTRP